MTEERLRAIEEVSLPSDTTELVREIRRLTLRWSREKPTEAAPGYYWHRRAPDDDAMVVFVATYGDVLWAGDDCDERLSDVSGEWAGPIAEPLDSKGGEA